MTSEHHATVSTAGPSARLRLGRVTAAAVAVACLATLAVFSLWPSSTRTSLTTRRQADSGTGVRATTAPVAAPATPPSLSSSPAAVPPAVAVARVVGAISTPLPTAVPAGAPDGPAAPASAAAACPLGLPTPAQSGGLQSLVAFAPAFGPFSSEAFAMAPAYAPLLSLFGPLLAQWTAQSTNAAAVVQPVLQVLEELDTAGFDVLAPEYGPQRSEVLTYETQLASTLAPYSEDLASSATGTCLVDLEGLLVSAGS